MRTLEEQINDLENNITFSYFMEALSNNYGTSTPEFLDYMKSLIELETEVLDSLYILLERDQLCDNCVNNYFDARANNSLDPITK